MGERKIRFGMVGGGSGAFIGAVHRHAIALDGRGVLVAGALSSTPERALASGREIGLEPDRTYPDWRSMLKAESARDPDDRIDAVSVVTPNDTHFEIASAALAAGFHVVVDKPMVCSMDEAGALAEAVRASGRVLAVTYNYSGYPMVREAASLVRSGELGRVRKVFVEYHQGWLATPLEQTGMKQAQWRTDPARSGGGGSLGDIGTHAMHLIGFVTGLEPEAMCAEVRTFVEGRRVDDDAAVLLRFAGGAGGTLTCSQVAFGEENGLTLRVYGERGAIAWRQESPNELVVRTDQGQRVVTRGSAGVSEAAAAATRLPAGHPEAFLEAFANVYVGAMDQMLGRSTPQAALVPDVEAGAEGVRFVARVLASAAGGGVWVPWRVD